MEIDFEKLGGLVPAIIQDAVTKNVLMLGLMNQEAYDKTIATKKVTFWSRSRNCLWTKGETSGNFLNLVSIQNDCDNDTLLVRFTQTVQPATKVQIPAGQKRIHSTQSSSSQSFRTSSTSATKKCQREATLPASSRKALTKWHKRLEKKLLKLLSKQQTATTRNSFTRVQTFSITSSFCSQAKA